MGVSHDMILPGETLSLESRSNYPTTKDFFVCFLASLLPHITRFEDFSHRQDMPELTRPQHAEFGGRSEIGEKRLFVQRKISNLGNSPVLAASPTPRHLQNLWLIIIVSGIEHCNMIDNQVQLGLLVI